MIKNQSNIYQFPMEDVLGRGVTGLAPTVKISKDGGSFAASTNSVTEPDTTNAPGLYQLVLTAAECNCDTMALVVNVPAGEWGAIMEQEELTPATSGATPQEIWNYTGQGGRTVTNTIPSASDNATAVWGAQTKEVTIATAQADTFATAAALTTVGDNVTAVKAKTDNLPASPAAVGSEMALTSAAISAVQNGLATSSELSALETHGDSYWHTASTSGLATGQGLENLATYGDLHWTTADVSGLAEKSDIPSAESIATEVWGVDNRSLTDSPDIQSELTTYGVAKTSDVPTAEDIWTYTDRKLTSDISVEITTENINDISEAIWNADDRTLTDSTPKPNQKSIVCTPTNVINSYGIPRLENWTNETSGTAAFDEKINTYIVLAKEKMATDLNSQINAAINYIGADNITELCAWLTGYNLYSDDESTDTDSLPETRYNQYLEQIHRIMENI